MVANPAKCAQPLDWNEYERPAATSMSDHERAAARLVGAYDARRSRARHELPGRIGDPLAVGVLAATMRDTRASTRSGNVNHARNPAALSPKSGRGNRRD